MLVRNAHRVRLNVDRLSNQSTKRSFSQASKGRNPKQPVEAKVGLVILVGITTVCCITRYKGVTSTNRLRSDAVEGYPADRTQVVRVAQREESHAETPAKHEKSTGSLFGVDWNAIGDRIRDAVVPDWAQALPKQIEKLQTELTLKAGSLADEIWQDAHDPELHPEIVQDANVRISTELCDEEKRFLEQRKIVTRKALAKYLDLKEKDVHPDDVPTIAMCGSGGGLRALVAGTSSYYSAQEAGLFGCITYTAGVSGSCWLQALYYSTITGQRHDRLIQHLKDRIGVHIAFPPALLGLLISKPTNKYLLCGPFEKFKGVENADFGIVDVYGLLLGARLFVPKGDLGVNYTDLKISEQERYVKDGKHPLPIYTAVRHEIPLEQQDHRESAAEQIERAKREAWFQWFEFTPFEFFCEEWECGIPTYAMGRTFKEGRTVWRDNGMCLPEIRVPLLLGIFGSAFCATLSHYYKEIRPIIRGLLGFDELDQTIRGRDGDLTKVHPVAPAQIPNFALGLKEYLPETCPDSVSTTPQIQLMDAGMSNNLPIYPLLRPGRNVDIIVTFDASADVRQDNWLRVADGYVKQRGIKGWPVGIGWPGDDVDTNDIASKFNKADDWKAKAANASKDEHNAAAKSLRSNIPGSVATPETKPKTPSELGPCTIWVGTIKSTDSPGFSSAAPHTSHTSLSAVAASSAGLALIYFPLLPNPKVEGVDPMKSDFMSTWNFIYTPEQVDKVVQLAKANFDEGAHMTKECVRAVYERKKRMRLEREEDEMRSELMAGDDG